MKLNLFVAAALASSVAALNLSASLQSLDDGVIQVADFDDHLAFDLSQTYDKEKAEAAKEEAKAKAEAVKEETKAKVEAAKEEQKAKVEIAKAEAEAKKAEKENGAKNTSGD